MKIWIHGLESEYRNRIHNVANWIKYYHMKKSEDKENNKLHKKPKAIWAPIKTGTPWFSGTAPPASNLWFNLATIM